MPGQTTLARHNSGSHLVPVTGGVVAWTRISNGIDYTCTFTELADVVNTISAPPVVSQKTANYTPVASDAFTIIEFTGSSAVRFTLPTDAATPSMPDQAVIVVVQIGVGALTWPTSIAGSTVVGGVRYDIPAGVTTPVRYVPYSWRKRAANEWILG